MKYLSITFLLILSSIQVSLFAQESMPVSNIKVVTWNAEHLAYPARKGCNARRSSEVKKLKAYTESLEADVIAFQEVHSEEAVRQILPDDNWHVIVSSRPDSVPYQCWRSTTRSTQQKVAFAVRNTIAIKGVNNFSELGLNSEGLRYGLAITIDTPMGETDILNVHLKSGCFVKEYSTSAKESCQTFKQQAPLLDKWMEERAKVGRPFIVLGDFNHRIGLKDNEFRKHLLTDDENKPIYAYIVTQKQKGCHPKYPDPIDHIIVGGDQRRNAKGSVKTHYYDGRMLSDHCAVSFLIK